MQLQNTCILVLRRDTNPNKQGKTKEVTAEKPKEQKGKRSVFLCFYLSWFSTCPPARRLRGLITSQTPQTWCLHSTLEQKCRHLGSSFGHSLERISGVARCGFADLEATEQLPPRRLRRGWAVPPPCGQLCREQGGGQPRRCVLELSHFLRKGC